MEAAEQKDRYKQYLAALGYSYHENQRENTPVLEFEDNDLPFVLNVGYSHFFQLSVSNFYTIGEAEETKAYIAVNNTIKNIPVAKVWVRKDRTIAASYEAYIPIWDDVQVLFADAMASLYSAIERFKTEMEK